MITRESFVDELLAIAPGARAAVEEHLDDMDGELRPHLLMSDLLRLTVRAFHSGQDDLARRLLTFANRCLEEGDDYVREVAAVSYVEHFGASEGETDELLDIWPKALRDELGR